MSNGQTTIDFEKQNVKNTSGNILVSGEFFEFPSGRNKLHIVNSNSQNMTAEISYTPYLCTVNILTTWNGVTEMLRILPYNSVTFDKGIVIGDAYDVRVTYEINGERRLDFRTR